MKRRRDPSSSSSSRPAPGTARRTVTYYTATRRGQLRLRTDRAEEENENNLLKLVPDEIWDKIICMTSTPCTPGYTLFPLASTCRFFRQKQKDIEKRKKWMKLETLFLTIPPMDEDEIDFTVTFSEDYIKWCFDMPANRGEDISARRQRCLYYAAGNGYLDLVEYCLEGGCYLNAKVSGWAAKGGSIPVLEFLNKHGCPITDIAYSSAAQFGNLPALKWLKAQGCHISAWMTDWTCSTAALKGHLDILIWLRSHKKPFPWSAETFQFAASGGHLHVMKWMRERGCPWNAETCSWASEKGHLETLKWLRQEGCPWDETTCSWAARKGHFETLRWAHENGCPWDLRTTRGAAAGGHLEMLEYVRSRPTPCPWDEHSCAWAARMGHLNVLKWLRKNGCPWNELVAEGAAMGSPGTEPERGHLEVIEWAVDNDCPWDPLTCLHLATDNKDQDMVDWIRNREPRMSTIEYDRNYFLYR